MDRFFILLLSFTLISACNGDDEVIKPGPEMRYTDLHEAESKPGSPQRLDLDGDGTKDFTFTTVLIGDPVLKRDRLAFVVASSLETYLLVIDNSETGKRYGKGEQVANTPPNGYEWFQFALVVMAEKVTSESDPPYWQGEWKDASHHYVAIQVRKNDHHYNGWVEVSMDKSSDKMILHNAAISKEPDKEVIVGY